MEKLSQAEIEKVIAFVRIDIEKNPNDWSIRDLVGPTNEIVLSHDVRPIKVRHHRNSKQPKIMIMAGSYTVKTISGHSDSQSVLYDFLVNIIDINMDRAHLAKKAEQIKNAKNIISQLP